jgi:hypothetical protein
MQEVLWDNPIHPSNGREFVYGFGEPQGGRLGFAMPEDRFRDRAAEGRFKDESAPLRSSEPSLKLTYPLVIRTLPSAAVFKQDWLSLAKVTGWLYILPESEMAADFNIFANPEGDNMRGAVGNITKGALVERILNAAKVAEREFAKETVVYHVGVFEIPLLRVSALSLEGGTEEGSQLYFVTYKDPTLDEQILAIETLSDFGRRLARVAKALSQHPGKPDTTYLENVAAGALSRVPEQDTTDPRAKRGQPFG